MGVINCAAPEANEGFPIETRNTGANANTRSRVRGDKVLILLVISFSTLQCGVSKGQALPSTQASSENGLEPTVGTEVPLLGEAPQLSSPALSPPAPQLSSPPRSPPQGQLAQFNQVISSLRSNNYTNGAQYIADYLFLLPLGSTVFVPTNTAFNGLNRSLALGPLLAYHAILQQLIYEQLLLLPAGTRFPSFVGNNNKVVITSVAPADFRVDEVRIIEGNICSSSTSALQISCHGVDGILNMTLWGQTGPAQLAPVPSPASEAPPAIPPTVESPSAPAPAPAPEEASPSAGSAPRAESRCTLFSVVFLYVFAAALIV